MSGLKGGISGRCVARLESRIRSEILEHRFADEGVNPDHRRPVVVDQPLGVGTDRRVGAFGTKRGKISGMIWSR